MKLKTIFTALTLLAAVMTGLAQNPYMPMWEHIPDGEPYVFEDPDKPGEYRVYVYGSHDSLIKYYCGREQVVWSAPVNDLSNWRYDGVIFENRCDRDGNLLNADGVGDVLYAPDVTVRTEKGVKVYYLYPNVQSDERSTLVARSLRPDGPFEVCNWDPENPRRTVGTLGFDPAVFVDDDGRVYGYWGFGESYGAELDPNTMAAVKPGCEAVHNLISGLDKEGIFQFFEASSIRKIKDKYILIYSRMSPQAESGIDKSNYNLSYAYSDNPLGPFTYGGIVIDARGRDVDESGKPVATACPFGNTHGGIVEIGGQWWVFYHRQTGTDQYSRQAMVASITIDVEEGPGGKVHIAEGEVTSEGFRTEGLDPLAKSAAGWACYFVNPDGATESFPNFFFSGSYVKASRTSDQSPWFGPYNLKQPLCPVVNNTSGSVVGFKYYNFDRIANLKNIKLKAHFKPEGVEGTVRVLVGGPSERRGGILIGEFRISASDPKQLSEYITPVSSLDGIKGKKPLFFAFESKSKGVSICEFLDFQFVAYS